MASLLDPLRHLTAARDREQRTVRTIIEATAQLLTGTLGMVAIATLVAEYGFFLSPEWESIAQAAHVLILYGFVFLVAVRIAASGSPSEFSRSHRVDMILVVLVLFLLLAPGTVTDILYTINPLLTASDVSAIYIALTQGILFSAFIPSALRASRRLMRRNVHPATLLVGSFGLIVLAGALLLLMPRATTEPLSILDALFTSTSAVCVTGLTVVDTATRFTPLGHGILLLLIQAGGLGIMTLTTVLGLLIGGSGGLREYATLQSLLGEESIGRIRRTLWTVTLVTLAFEAAGALVLYQRLDPLVAGTGSHAAFFSIFHSVSAFCNAGFSLTSEGLMHPLFRMNVTVLATIMILVVVGGVGFPVMSNIGRIIWSRLVRRPFRGHLSLQSKIVLWSTFVLLVVGTAALFMVEHEFGQPSMTMGERWLTAAFHSVIARTAGFNTIDIASMTMPGLFVLMVLMWIGGSPGSTAGGVKTTAVAVALLNIRAIVTGAERVEAFRTTVSSASIVRAFSTILLSVAVIAALVFLLLLTDPVSFEAAVFEVISAVGTVGLTTGITPSLSYGGKLVIIAGMFIGRIGVLSFAIAMTGQWQRRRAEYPAENVLVT